MKFLEDYITDYSSTTSPNRKPLATRLSAAKDAFDCRPPRSGSAKEGFQALVDAYNYIGNNKDRYNVKQNQLRNLNGALLQDYMMSLIYEQLKRYPRLDVFTEAQVALGLYPLWTAGHVRFEPVSEQSDLAVGYLWDTEQRQVHLSTDPWPRDPILSVQTGHTVLPLLAISSKIRVSKPEFFDWLGRAQLMVKGNPHCLNIQVGLRREMRISIIEVAQMHENFFLLGSGNEGTVIGFPEELDRLLERVSEHLKERMGNGGPVSEELEEELESIGDATPEQETPDDNGE